MVQQSSSGCSRPMWFVMLFHSVLVVLRCSRLVKVVGNCFALLQDAMGGLLYDCSSCFKLWSGCFRCLGGFRL